jgi:hypothetical protein
MLNEIEEQWLKIIKTSNPPMSKQDFIDGSGEIAGNKSARACWLYGNINSKLLAQTIVNEVEVVVAANDLDDVNKKYYLQSHPSSNADELEWFEAIKYAEKSLLPLTIKGFIADGHKGKKLYLPGDKITREFWLESQIKMKKITTETKKLYGINYKTLHIGK